MCMYECEYERVSVHACECACRRVQVSIQMWVCEHVDGGGACWAEQVYPN